MIQGANESIEAYTRRMRYTYEQVYGSVHDVNAMQNLILVTGLRWSVC